MDKFSVIAGDIKIQDVTMKKNKNETRAEFEYSWDHVQQPLEGQIVDCNKKS